MDVARSYVPPAPPVEPDLSPRGCGGGFVQDLLGEAGPLDHVDHLLVDDVPAAGPQAAVGIDLDPSRVIEGLYGVQDPVAHECGGLDEVRVDVEDAETDVGIPVLP